MNSTDSFEILSTQCIVKDWIKKEKLLPIVNLVLTIIANGVFRILLKYLFIEKKNVLTAKRPRKEKKYIHFFLLRDNLIFAFLSTWINHKSINNEERKRKGMNMIKFE